MPDFAAAGTAASWDATGCDVGWGKAQKQGNAKPTFWDLFPGLRVPCSLWKGDELEVLQAHKHALQHPSKGSSLHMTQLYANQHPDMTSGSQPCIVGCCMNAESA